MDGIYDERYCSGVDYGEKEGMGDKFQECLREVLTLADTMVDFSHFETNGDGYIDAITFIHSGYDAAMSHGIPERIWSHQGWLSHEGYVSTFISSEGVKVEPYTINPALHGDEGTRISSLSTIAHETAHFMVCTTRYIKEKLVVD